MKSATRRCNGMKLPTWDIDVAILEAIEDGVHSHRRIAWEIGVSRAAVDRHLAGLIEEGLVVNESPLRLTDAGGRRLRD